jgi:hypothetical protein
LNELQYFSKQLILESFVLQPRYRVAISVSIALHSTGAGAGLDSQVTRVVSFALISTDSPTDKRTSEAKAMFMQDKIKRSEAKILFIKDSP